MTWVNLGICMTQIGSLIYFRSKLQRIIGRLGKLRTIDERKWGGARGAASLFLFLRELSNGGAMAEGDEVSEAAKDDRYFGERPEWGQKKALVTLEDADDMLCEMADWEIRNNLREIMTCIMENIRKMHLPSVKLLLELAARMKRRRAVPVEVYESLATVLWKDLSKRDVDL